MKRTALILAFAIAAAAIGWAKEYTYSVDWHWGFVDIHAGDVTISIDADENGINGAVAGQSVPIRGDVMSITDTIDADLTLDRAEINYIDGVYSRHPKNEWSDNYRNIHGQGRLDASDETMEAVNITAMLPGFFYYAQQMDFDQMQEGDQISVPLAGDGEDGRMLITYHGTEESDYGQAYSLTLIFDIGDAAQYPISCLVSTADRSPLTFSTTLRIGEVQMALL